MWSELGVNMLILILLFIYLMHDLMHEHYSVINSFTIIMT